MVLRISCTCILSVIIVVLAICVNPTRSQYDPDTCIVSNTDGCSLGRAPRYLAVAPNRVRPDQIFQVFVTVLRLEYGNTPVTVHASVLRDGDEIATQAMRFNRPSSRILQLKIPTTAGPGDYRLQVTGKLQGKTSGFAFISQSDLQYSPKQASVFIQMSKPLYRQEQMVHFRVIPVKPDLMPKYGTAVIYIEDPTGFPVQRWQAVQTNAGGVMSESFQLSDQPNYGTWHIRVVFFGHTYRHPFIVEEFWEPRFDVNVTTPAYVMADDDLIVKGVMMANQTSGRPCLGNASVTAFFLPSAKEWKENYMWEKPYREGIRMNPSDPSPVKPEYTPLKDIPVKDYPLYFPYEYRHIDYYEGRYDFEWTASEIKTIAKRGYISDTLEEREILFYFNVTDWYSGVVRTGWSGTYIKKNDVTLKWVGGPVRTFKPGSKARVQLAISNADGTPVKDGSTVRTSTLIDNKGSDYELQHTVMGVVELEINLGFNAYKFTVDASYIGGDDLSSEEAIDATPEASAMQMIGSRYYSPSGSYISVSTSTIHPKVNQYMIFHVSTSQYVPRIFYQIIAKGSIIDGDELEMTSRQKTFSVALSKDMDPVARVLVYYVQLPNEIVADVLNFFVNGSNHNQVRLESNLGKDFSRDTIEFNAYADPDSFLVTSGVLLDFYQRGLNDGITENKLIDELMSFDEPANGSYRHLWRVSDTDFKYSFFHGADYGVDSTTSLETAGLVLMTDINITRLPSIVTCDTAQNEYPCFSGGADKTCYTIEQRCNGEYDGCPNDGADEWGCEDYDDLEKTNPMDRVSRVMRFYDNSTWAWHEIFVKPDGRVDFRVDVPKYPLSWMVNALSVSRDLGLGIMTRPLRYDSIRYMYIQVEHPEKIVMGEQIGIRVTVFSYWYEDDYIEVLVTFHSGEDTSFVVVDDFGITSSYDPKTHKGDQQTIVFLEPGQSKDIYMPIIPDKDLDLSKGTIDFHVSAACFMEKDDYYGTMKVQSNGVLNYYHTPYMVDLINQPSIQIPYLDVIVPQLFRKSDIRINMYVPGSASAMTTFFGDVVVPGFFEDYLNAENILHRPYGGGEMATFNFAYNLLSLRFMRHSNQLHPDTLQTALGKMRLALQRMYSYMHEDDKLVSFKMFRDDPHPSLWLTAFVGKTLSRAIVGEKWERELYIPQRLINSIVGYVCSRQNRTTGAFMLAEEEIAYDRKMASLKDSASQAMFSHEIPLTAYVLIALNDMATSAQNSMGCLQTAKRRASRFLSHQASSITSDEVFFMAITTYALSLTEVNSGTFERQLLKMQRNGSYFADSIVYPNPRRPQNNVWYNLPRQELQNEAYAIQSTAYALMALIPSDSLSKENRDQMMAWINTLRNSVGGFASTQDTIVALEALYTFTKKDPNRNEFDLLVNLESTSADNWRAFMHMNKTDYVHLDKSCLPRNDVYGYIMPSAQGVGRGMLQLTTMVRVEKNELLKKQMRKDNIPTNPPIQFFSIEKRPVLFSGRNNSIMEMTNCVSWVYQEKSLTSGLAVLEVDIPTGYVTMNDSLRDYVKSGLVRNLRRAEYYGRKVVFYFDHLDASRTCVSFRADRWHPVSNATREYRIRVYDYYEPGMHQTELYTTVNLNRLNICYVCGSYQCPYCPYFNAATVATAGFSLWFMCTIVFTLLKWFIHRDSLGFMDLFIT